MARKPCPCVLLFRCDHAGQGNAGLPGKPAAPVASFRTELA